MKNGFLASIHSNIISAQSKILLHYIFAAYKRDNLTSSNKISSENIYDFNSYKGSCKKGSKM